MLNTNFWMSVMSRKSLNEKTSAGALTGIAAAPEASSRFPRGTRIREVPAVRRAGQILRYLAGSEAGLTVSKLALALDIIPSTCLHILRELMAAHLVAFDPNGKTYRLGLGLLSLTNGLRIHDSFIRAAEQRLWHFAQETGISVSAQERDRNDAVIVAAVAAGEGLEAPLGKRVALLSAAGGRLFAGHLDWSRSETQKQFARVPWHKPPIFNDWLKEVEIAKSRGYAVDNGNFRLGVTSIAASVPDNKGVVRRVISINVVTAQVNAKRISALVRSLKTTGSDISNVVP
jgi:DNA-binding IclR family transcriptional regulator